jgi:hypothetical protein
MAQDITHGAAAARRSLAWAPAFARDAAIVLAVIGVYFLLRGMAPTRIDDSVALTNDLVAFEKATHTFWEPQVQDWSLQNHWIQELANFTYAYLHFPVLAAVGAWPLRRGSWNCTVTTWASLTRSSAARPASRTRSLRSF